MAYNSLDEQRTMISQSKGHRIPSFADGFVPEEVKKRLEHIVCPHVDSFNYFLQYGLAESILHLPPTDIKIDNGVYAKIYYTNAEILSPTKQDDGNNNNHLTPREARERGLSYAGLLLISVRVVFDDETDLNLSVRFGNIPIMVKSERCHLNNLGSRKLVELREEANEMGGYFIVRGLERVVRLLQMPRRNHAMALERSSFKNRGPLYSDKGVTMRCVRSDQSSVTMTMHYLNNGGATLRVVIRKQEFLLPVVIVAKALVNINDKELFNRILQGDSGNTFMTTRLELLLRDAKRFNTFTKSQCNAYLGSLFRMFLPVTDRCSDEEAGKMLIDQFIFIHVSDAGAKLECLMHMLRKLFAFAQGRCAPDNPDALMNHEILQPGHLITAIVKEKLAEVAVQVGRGLRKDYLTAADKAKFLTEFKSVKYFQRVFDRSAGLVGNRIASFLSTGNLVSSTGLDLMQVSGFTIVAERLNIFRYMSHFQSVHRGQFFTTMKTTTVRKLLPESWGFMCPVHTPDGSPCGLLNHLCRQAVLVSFNTQDRLPTTPKGLLQPNFKLEASSHSWASGNALRRLLAGIGVVPAGMGAGDGQVVLNTDCIPLLVDGNVFGGVLATEAAEVVKQLRLLKVSSGVGGAPHIDPTMEIVYIPRLPYDGGAYAGIYLFTEPGRMIRPVIHRSEKCIEWVGPMEQVFMDIACLPEDVREETTHIEIDPVFMLSQIASFTPFSDYNQSPRNMYQCQMGKQTMGTPAHALKHRADNKLFRIQNTQSPLVQTQAYREYCMDEYPQGVNAVVAVISFTGYDMEDAMIINKAAYERGFGHGSVYKTVVIDLEEEEKKAASSSVRPSYVFGNRKPLTAAGEVDYGDGEEDDAAPDKFCSKLDYDGLPEEGELVAFGEPLCCLVDTLSGKHHIIKHKESESAFIDTVRVVGAVGADGAAFGGRAKSAKPTPLRRVSISMRYRRNPVIGDKFSSRHGQKGTVSVLWPQENMPFSDSGITPDVLINPHAFPSRMTIGMLIESMAGKAGAMHGMFQDGTPFRFHEKQRVIDYVGEQLRSCGFSYYGSEPLYNGLTGNAMHAEIFMGVVFYQRLRHMVSDKSQVRSTGAVMAITRQPVKGRKKHGGIRLGEMERDALLSHGVSFCLHDRLMNCSDSHVAHVCSRCGGLLTVRSTLMSIQKHLSSGTQGVQGLSVSGRSHRAQEFCMACGTHAHIRPVYMPYVYRYLTNELAAMGIKLTLKLND